MVNQTTSPVICKALNYKEEVYAKFAKEVVATAASDRNNFRVKCSISKRKVNERYLLLCNQWKGKADGKKPKKQMNLTINISSADLRTKA